MTESVNVREAEPVADPPAPAPKPRQWWRRLGTGLAITACLAWLGFVALHRILSGRFFWWGPFDLLPPILFAAVPVVLVGLALLPRIRWRLVAAPLLALLLGAGLSGINLATLWHDMPPAPPGAITVVAWNTEYWDQDLTSGGQRGTADFYRFLRELDADVYLLSEYAHVDFSLPDLFAQARVIDQLALVRRTFPEYEIVLEGRDMTLSRLPVVGSRALDSGPWLPADLREPPAAQRDHASFYRVQTLRTDIQVVGRTVSFYNAHLFQPPTRMLMMQSYQEWSAPELDRQNHFMREASVRAIRTDLAGNQHPAVLAGDLNTSPVMGILDRLPDRLVDHTAALSSLYPTSWEIGGLNLWRLDWLFTTPDVTVHSYRLGDPDLLSDHRPQHITLSVSGR